MNVAPYFPDQEFPVLFAMSADEPYLYYPKGTLTEKHQAQAKLVMDIMAMFQVGMLILAKTTDSIAFYNAFQCSPWRHFLSWHHEILSCIFDDVTPKENFYYYPRDSFYQAIAADKQRQSFNNIIVSQMSHANEILHQDQLALLSSQLAHSKMELANRAHEFGIPVPPSMVCKRMDLSSQKVADIFSQYENQVILKISGMGGANNVAAVENPDQALEYLTGFPDDTPVLLQQKLDTSRYKEMTVDLHITERKAHIDNIRNVLVYDGLWIGNHMNSNLSLTESQKSTLLKVADYVHSVGYTNPHGLNCGIDFFIHDDELLVTEINARWTGGMLASQVVKKLKLQSTDLYAFIDHIVISDMEKYMGFVEANIYDASEKSFAVIPIGFSPYVQNIEEQERILIWMSVVGDFAAFIAAKDDALGANEIITANKIGSILHHIGISSMCNRKEIKQPACA